MSLISEELWRACMGDRPMPEGCTFEMMWAMHAAMAMVEGKEYAAEQIRWYESLWRRFKPLYDEEPENYTEIMKLIKNGITFWREELSND